MADDLDSLEDLYGDEMKTARVERKFAPKSKFQPRKKVPPKGLVASSKAVLIAHSGPNESSEPIQTAKPLEQSLNVVPNDNTKPTGQTIGSTTSSDAVPNDKSDLHANSVEEVNAVPKDSGLAAEGDAVTAGDPIILSDDMDGRPAIEEMDVMESINMMELTTKSGHSAENTSNPTFQNNDAVDLSSPGCIHALPTESTSDLMNEESLSFMEEPQLDACTHMEGMPEIPAKLASRRAKTGNSKNNDALDPDPQQQKASTSSLENGSRRSLRPRKRGKSTCKLVDEDETLASGELSEEHPLSSANEENTNDEQPQVENESQKKNLKRKGKKKGKDKSTCKLVDEGETLTSGELAEEHPLSSANEENTNDEQPQVENESQKKNLKRKGKKNGNDKEKSPRKKSKKAKEASEQETHAKPKKNFRHSTRRRQVDKNLLNIPEEEFDPSVVSLRDLILIAEYREKQKKIEQASTGTPATQQSTENSDYINDAAGHYSNNPAEEYNNDEEDYPIAEDADYFNYQSRMERTPRVRWSKEDTELFYKAVQQFGTDFSMIAQLFPGRIREQIRNKYKKEERQHPLRLREALTNRSKDLSYFGKVIDNLNKIRAEEEEQLDKLDDLASTGEPDEEALIDDDDEGNPKRTVKDDEGKYEHIEEEEDGDGANGFTEVQSTTMKEDEKEEMVEEEEEEVEEEDEMFLFNYSSAR